MISQSAPQLPPIYKPRAAEAYTKEHLLAMTDAGRLMVVHRLSERLDELAEDARTQRKLDLERTLFEIAKAFRSSSFEIAAAKYGPSLISELAESVDRVQRKLLSSGTDEH